MSRQITTRLPQKAIIALLCLWFGTQLIGEMSHRSRISQTTLGKAAATQRWQLGSRHERQLRQLLDLARTEIPAGSHVGLVAPASMPRNRVFFLGRWAAFLAPSLDIQTIQPANPGNVEFCLAYRRRLGRKHFQLLAESPMGAVYRVVP